MNSNLDIHLDILLDIKYYIIMYNSFAYNDNFTYLYLEHFIIIKLVFNKSRSSRKLHYSLG